MDIGQIKNNLSELVKDFSPETFIYDLLKAYGTPKSTLKLVKKGNYNLSRRDDQIILKRKLFFQEAASGEDLHTLIETLREDKSTHRHNPRFILVTDYKTVLAVDTKTQDTLDIPIQDIGKDPYFFGPWAGFEKSVHYNEQEADIKAAEKMAKIHDEIVRENELETEEDHHNLNVFLTRLLFCFFAEDTGIFEDNAFTNAISSHTKDDGSDLAGYLNQLFEVLNTKDQNKAPAYLKGFDYVNGGLFRDALPAPRLTRKARKIMIECGELDWAEIHPDIFGSMFQAVVHTDQRSALGQHYTSVPNIMKVINPLFMDGLREKFEKNLYMPKNLVKLLERLAKIRIFDPACGSGNFLIIAYKQMRELEIEIIQRLAELSHIAHKGETHPEFTEISEIQRNFVAGYKPTFWSNIQLTQFYGIELDDFAHEVAILSLWLAEHQMNVKFKEIFGQGNPSLPLKEGGNIVCANATRIPWEDVCPKDKDAEIYVLGNPPYKGARRQEECEKLDMEYVLKSFNKYKDLDYISCWFYLAAQYIKGVDEAFFAFVSTNSISQGQQVALLWPNIFKLGVEINFAYQSFKWTNNAKKNAGVTCTIIGMQNVSANRKKVIFAEGVRNMVEKINPYLTTGSEMIVSQRKIPLARLPRMNFGNMPNDGGGLILSKEEKDKIIKQYPDAARFIRLLLGSQEYIRGQERYCLWIKDSEVVQAYEIKPIADRIARTRQHRLKSKDKGTNKLAKRSHQFRDINESSSNSIVIPSVSSERRRYIPMGFLEPSTIISNAAQAIYDAEPWVFGLITSKMHMAWVKAVAGQLETRIRYSSALCYNTFPVPDLTERQKETITTHVYDVLAEREKHSEKTMAQLYDPDKMPQGLREAHKALDEAVERCYRSKPFTSDEERLEHLFKLYEKMIAEEKKGGVNQHD